MTAGPPAKKGKGLSFDEKRKRMEEFFHEKVLEILMPLISR